MERVTDANRLVLIRQWMVDELVGKLLTYTDATHSDPVQRKAHKDIIKQTIYAWFSYHALNGLDDKAVDSAVSGALQKLKQKS